MKRIAVLLTFTVMSTVGMAQTAAAPDPQRTHGYFNGRAWLTMSETAKTYYLIGFKEGVLQASSWVGGEKGWQTFANLSLVNMSYAELSTALDQFYGDPLNVVIAIPDTIFVIAEKTRGHETDAIVLGAVG
jgi:hypothetical protein